MVFLPQNDTVTLRSSVFMVSNVKWPRNSKRDRENTHENKILEVKQVFQGKLGLTNGIPENRMLIRSIHVNTGKPRSNRVFVTMRNLSCIPTDKILSALANVFEPFVKSSPIQVSFESTLQLATEWEW